MGASMTAEHVRVSFSRGMEVDPLTVAGRSDDAGIIAGCIAALATRLSGPRRAEAEALARRIVRGEQ